MLDDLFSYGISQNFILDLLDDPEVSSRDRIHFRDTIYIF